ncbi:hypothetical protein SBA2_450027 [Acidobacteriia bacterium SbA2]|nr:hypothetical protein SBA2_450027 [Acidobacteriia bacterium SbA2]
MTARFRAAKNIRSRFPSNFETAQILRFALSKTTSFPRKRESSVLLTNNGPPLSRGRRCT